MSDILGVVSISIGLFFYIFGIAGMVRFPDVYSRIHAAGKVSVLGIVFFVIGTALLMPETTMKAILLGVFMIITQPVSSHAVASAAYRSGASTTDWSRNDLETSQSTVSLDQISTVDHQP